MKYATLVAFVGAAEAKKNFTNLQNAAYQAQCDSLAPQFCQQPDVVAHLARLEEDHDEIYDCVAWANAQCMEHMNDCSYNAAVAANGDFDAFMTGVESCEDGAKLLTFLGQAEDQAARYADIVCNTEEAQAEIAASEYTTADCVEHLSGEYADFLNSSECWLDAAVRADGDLDRIMTLGENCGDSMSFKTKNLTFLGEAEDLASQYANLYCNTPEAQAELAKTEYDTQDCVEHLYGEFAYHLNENECYLRAARTANGDLAEVERLGAACDGGLKFNKLTFLSEASDLAHTYADAWCNSEEGQGMIAEGGYDTEQCVEYFSEHLEGEFNSNDCYMAAAREANGDLERVSELGNACDNADGDLTFLATCDELATAFCASADASQFDVPADQTCQEAAVFQCNLGLEQADCVGTALNGCNSTGAELYQCFKDAAELACNAGLF